MYIDDLRKANCNNIILSPKGTVFWVEFPDRATCKKFGDRLNNYATRLGGEYKAQTYHALGIDYVDVRILRRIEIVKTGRKPRKYTKRNTVVP